MTTAYTWCTVKQTHSQVTETSYAQQYND